VAVITPQIFLPARTRSGVRQIAVTPGIKQVSPPPLRGDEDLDRNISAWLCYKYPKWDVGVACMHTPHLPPAFSPSHLSILLISFQGQSSTDQICQNPAMKVVEEGREGEREGGGFHGNIALRVIL